MNGVREGVMERGGGGGEEEVEEEEVEWEENYVGNGESKRRTNVEESKGE